MLQAPAIMKWPKRHRNQATHVFTHVLNKQENKGKACHELCSLQKVRGCPGWLSSIGHRTWKGRPMGKRRRRTLFLKPRLDLLLRLQAGWENPGPQMKPTLNMAISDIAVSSEKTSGSTKAGDSSAAPNTHTLSYREP